MLIPLLDVAAAAAPAAHVTGSPLGDLFISQGPMGTIVIMVLAALRYYVGQNEKLRAQVDALQEARLNDGNVARDKLLQMSDKVHATTDDLVKVADRMEERNK